MLSFARILRCSADSSFHVVENGKIGVLKLTRMASRNAISPQMCKTISQAASVVSASGSDIRAMILTGDESCFSAGRDLKASLIHSPDEARIYLHNALTAVKDLLNSPIPIVVSIEKICLGLGLELALAGDIRICGTSTQFGFPEINLSLFPGCGGAVMLPALLGNVSLAQDWILTGRRIPADEAKQAAIVSRVVGDGQAFDESLRVAKDLARKNRELLIKTKHVVKFDFNNKVNSQWWSIAESLRKEVGTHPDHRMALEAFSRR
ncbi:Enoyl-CoA hydratase [Perkinsus sp. BL_2016]|nr:Enoyl-CoA hydratase [Perkinsus sp. BL_2016]